MRARVLAEEGRITQEEAARRLAHQLGMSPAATELAVHASRGEVTLSPQRRREQIGMVARAVAQGMHENGASKPPARPALATQAQPAKPAETMGDRLRDLLKRHGF